MHYVKLSWGWLDKWMQLISSTLFTQACGFLFTHPDFREYLD